MTGLVQLLTDWKGPLPPGGAICEPKIDGFRAARFPGIDGKNRLWTRNGFEIHGAAHILHQLARMEREAGEPLFLDGEFQVGGTLAATKHWCESGWKLGGEAGTLHLFDAMPLSQWRAGGTPIPLYQRKAWLKELVAACAGEEWEWREGSCGRDEGATPVVLIEDEWVGSAQDVLAAACRIWAAGGEGVVIKDADAPYERKRSQTWQKIKRENQHKWRMAA
jgi:ATP-dependent DNA ligase